MLTAPRRLLLVHAHPDDETLCTGGTIARYAAAGVQVTLVTCTLGEEGEVIPSRLRGLAVDAADQLGGYRVGELRAACTALGVTDQRFLGGMGRWRDSGMAGTAANTHPRAFAAGDLDEQVAQLAEIVAEVRPQVVICYDPRGGYGHPDHIRAHQVTTAVAERAPGLHAVYWHAVSESVLRSGLAALAALPGLPHPLPADGELPAVPDDAVTTTVDVTEHRPARIAALRAHATQVSVWEGEAEGECCYALSNGIAQPILPVEQFTLAGGRAEPAQVADDLFGGLSETDPAFAEAALGGDSP
ncbi:MAG TPA: N-acetyl-1-D-myo-inositol-2-amino-2-deoxy-alpha-D-glucopyranoside deacetylase [Pseudonocardiaceae bacterium]